MKTDFHIDSKPVSISFECPSCEAEVVIPWREIDVPDYWGDNWPEVKCPECDAAIELGDWEYD